MKAFIKWFWFTVNILAILTFCGIYLYFTYPLFIPPYEEYNVIFFLMFFIFLEGFFESVISCYASDEDSWTCWISALFLSVAIVLLYLTSYKLYTDMQSTVDTSNPIAAVLSVLLMSVNIILSPMLISKYSSWVLLFINFLGEREHKYQWVFPLILLTVTVVGNIVMCQMDISQGMHIAYICVFGPLSIVSLILTLKNL